MEIRTAKKQLTNEQALDLVRDTRNDLVKDFLDDRHLKAYVADHYGVRDLSSTQVGMIRNELKELLISPVNENHYAPLINQMLVEETIALTGVDDRLFYKELEPILKRHMYE